MEALDLPVLCLVTDRHRCDGRALEEVVAGAVEGGAGMVQLRERDLAPGPLYAMAKRLREITMGKALLLISDRVDVALAAGADGVQLPEDGLGVEAARRVAGTKLLVGRSVHSAEGARAAERDGADLLVVGAVFATTSHPAATPLGVEILRRVGERVRIPFLAIGGVTADNVAAVIESGASGAAAITAITQSAVPAEAARELAAMMTSAWTGVPGRAAARRI